ncbi:MAG: class I SAM-dependent methyltransferase [Pseudonocardia sp.]|nr:class I SAM-dependent methyltransferase [Pseudonocardia sp.]MBO0877383.1 class I SAM-dependent methyltransferase [Pseudonocardia sp.]
MSSGEPSPFSAGWLALREGADADARAAELIAPLRAHLAGTATTPLVIRDLGCGTGSLRRWLAGRLHGPQHWILHDRDPELLARARAGDKTAADGAPVTVECRLADVTDLRASDLAGTSLVAASALLDLLTAREVDGLADACVGAGCPALLTLSVTGRVELTPGDPLDVEVAAAFDAHQRRTKGGRRLLGPDAAAVAASAFRARGARVRSRSSPWRLGPERSALAAEWLRGWVGAAGEQRPDLPVDDYLRRRLATCAAGELRVVVQHGDLLALPAGGCA